MSVNPMAAGQAAGAAAGNNGAQGGGGAVGGAPVPVTTEQWDEYKRVLQQYYQQSSGFARDELQAKLQDAEKARQNSIEIAKISSDTQRYGINVQNETRLKELVQQQAQFSERLGFDREQAAVQNAVSIANLTGVYNGSPTMAAQNQAFTQRLAMAGLTGTIDGSPTLQAQQVASQIAAQAAQTAQGNAQLTGTLNGTPTLAAQNQAFTQALQLRQQGLSESQISGWLGTQATLPRQQFESDAAYRTRVQDANEAKQKFDQGVQEGTLTGIYNGMQTLAGQQTAAQIAQGNAQLTGTLNGQATLGAQGLQEQIAARVARDKQTWAQIANEKGRDAANAWYQQQQVQTAREAHQLAQGQLGLQYLQTVAQLKQNPGTVFEAQDVAAGVRNSGQAPAAFQALAANVRGRAYGGQATPPPAQSTEELIASMGGPSAADQASFGTPYDPTAPDMPTAAFNSLQPNQGTNTGAVNLYGERGTYDQPISTQGQQAVDPNAPVSTQGQQAALANASDAQRSAGGVQPGAAAARGAGGQLNMAALNQGWHTGHLQNLQARLAEVQSRGQTGDAAIIQGEIDRLQGTGAAGNQAQALSQQLRTGQGFVQTAATNAAPTGQNLGATGQSFYGGQTNGPAPAATADPDAIAGTEGWDPAAINALKSIRTTAAAGGGKMGAGVWESLDQDAKASFLAGAQRLGYSPSRFVQQQQASRVGQRSALAS